MFGAHPREHGRGAHPRKGDTRRVVVREHGGHVEGALRLGDADDAHRRALARVQDDRNLVDGGAPQLVPQAFRDDDGDQALVGVAAHDPSPGEHARAEDDLVGGVHALECHAVDHVGDVRERVAAELPAGAGLSSFDDIATAAGEVRGAFGVQAQGDGAPLVELRQLARGLQEQVAERDDDRHGGDSRDHAHEGEDDSRLLDLDLAPGLDERAQELTNGVHCSPSSDVARDEACSAPASSPECPASARCARAEGSSTSCSVPS